MSAGWDHECDVVVVGSGFGGMTAALTARHAGLDTVVIEKLATYGGSSALSGGGVWIPDNPWLRRAGIDDSLERARTYLDAIVGDRVPAARREAFLTGGREMMEFLDRDTRWMQFRWVPGYADYHPEEPGGEPRGRTLEPLPIDSRLLGEDAASLNVSGYMRPPKGMWTTQIDYRELTQVMRTFAGKKAALRTGWRMAVARVTGRRMLSLGAAGVARMRLSLRDAGVPLWLSTPLTDLVVEEGTVVGVRAERDGAPIAIRARRGVILAAGGFERNEEMRKTYQQEPVNNVWTSGSPGNTGDAIVAGMELGAAVDLMDDAWWGPSVDAGAMSIFLLAERSLPGAVVVNAAGRRYVNEAAPYVNFVHRMYEAQKETGIGHIPSFLIIDQTYRNRYPFFNVRPRQPFPPPWTKYNLVTIAETVDDLARSLGVPADALKDTFSRYNEFARTGQDLDFGKGDSAYDRYYGDPTVRPNPCLGAIGTPPFYAFRLVPGDLGTKGGLVTDEHARVLRQDASVIAGLYAVGNTSASVMGNEYPGAGGTLGPAMAFGYLAARHIATHQTTEAAPAAHAPTTEAARTAEGPPPGGPASAPDAARAVGP